MNGSPLLTMDGAVATITLQRPDKANRLTPDDLATLYAHIATVNALAEVLVLRLQSGGKYFCSGFDIGKIGDRLAIGFGTLVDALELARPVTIAVIHGGLYGGAVDLALACDFRIGVTGGDMFNPAARLGLHYYATGLQRYVERIGLDAAKRLYLTAERIDATEMHRIGYLTQLVEPGDLAMAAAKLTTTLAGMAPIALLGMKKNLNRIARGTADATEIARDCNAARESADLQEGRAAWAEKRAPKFSGR
ncbi:Carnitinyl-CoA dehydratase [Variovorax sp. SRS16]|uniref:enoyl-CoA hydratase/isomerase family protein n=1 Tax=Variovorax sp. SRS16 TaxID=282217 RepID=UPI001316C168|nr:enoyl-CoA hydratase/isomerase family protein [Variovorax sp. SRS16]VTU13213.1 Carnitinyl-CoA dehydratase [Variovorax sp. SRS16]